jgi:Icc-related predicted phosphoesterase
LSFLFKNQVSSNRTRLFFATDLHASERAFRKFINAGKFYDVNVLVLGGDVLGKLAVPILREPNGRFRVTFGGETLRGETAAELQAVKDRLGLLGIYYELMDEQEYRALVNDRAAIESLFRELARERLERWIELAESRLQETGIRCYVTGGNDDYPEVLEALNRAGARAFIACEDKVVALDDAHSMISEGYSTPTPWKTPREVPDARLGEMIDALAAKVPDLSRCVFNFHEPPVDSTLDTCPMLDWESDPPTQIMRGGRPVLYGAGSRAVRRAIEQYQPLLGLHGHIHESAGAVRIGRTLCLNPGSEYAEGILRGAIVNMANGKLEGYQLTAG